MTLVSFLPVLLRGALVTLEVTASSGVIAFLLAMLVGTAQLSRVAVVRTAAKTYVEILRGTSALIQLFYLFFVLPVLGIDITPMEAAAFGLGLTFSAYGAEIVRAGILSVDRGQWDAARALGMPHSLAFRRIIAPQAFVTHVGSIRQPIGGAAEIHFTGFTHHADRPDFRGSASNYVDGQARPDLGCGSSAVLSDVLSSGASRALSREAHEHISWTSEAPRVTSPGFRFSLCCCEVWW